MLCKLHYYKVFTVGKISKSSYIISDQSVVARDWSWFWKNCRCPGQDRTPDLSPHRFCRLVQSFLGTQPCHSKYFLFVHAGFVGYHPYRSVYITFIVDEFSIRIIVSAISIVLACATIAVVIFPAWLVFSCFRDIPKWYLYQLHWLVKKESCLLYWSLCSKRVWAIPPQQPQS